MASVFNDLFNTINKLMSTVYLRGISLKSTLNFFFHDNNILERKFGSKCFAICVVLVRKYQSLLQ